jgi:hypothetical protein
LLGTKGYVIVVVVVVVVVVLFMSLYVFLCLSSLLDFISSLPNLLGTKGYVVVADPRVYLMGK